MEGVTVEYLARLPVLGCAHKSQCQANSAAQLSQPGQRPACRPAPPAGGARDRTPSPEGFGAFSLLLVKVAEQTLDARIPRRRLRNQVLTKSSDPGCPTEDDDVSVTIHGEALTFTDSSLRNFFVGINPHQD